MAEKIIGLSRELIIHPGEILKDELEARNMTQEELAQRCGCTSKNISCIINGITDISVAFAKKLEYVLGIDASFWNALQCNYDQEIHEYEEINKISQSEYDIIKEPKFKKVISFLKKCELISAKVDLAQLIIELRRFLEISNLSNIASMTYNSAFRVAAASIDIYVMYAWIRLCEVATQGIECKQFLDKEKLKESLSEIKSLMFETPSIMKERLTNILADCGIAFNIVPSFNGAPVQGFIKKIENKTILCMTIRQAYADIFWFTLFHEIAHILNDDYKRTFIDFQSGMTVNDIEMKADQFSKDFLINQQDYIRFVQEEDFSEIAIRIFAETQNVQPFIIIGRLQKEKIIGYNQFYNMKARYKWVEA